MSKNRIPSLFVTVRCVVCAGGLAGALVAPASGSTGFMAPPMGASGQDAHELFDLMVVVPQSAMLRCGDQDVFYAVGELPKDTRVQAVGESEEYTMILMPESIGAFVPANEVDAAIDGKTVTLSFDSKLRAPSHLLGMSGSWKGMYATPLVSGTRLDVIEVMKSDSGEVLGYRVVAPKGPKGERAIAYIRTDMLRAATGAEARAFTNSGNTNPVVIPEHEEVPTPTLAGADTDHVKGQVEGEVDEQVEVDTSLMDPMVTGEPGDDGDDGDDSSQGPIEISNSAPVDAGEAEKDDAQGGDSIQRAQRNGLISASALEDLEAAFAHARELPREALDEALSELLAEFTRTRAQAQDGSSLARALDQRIEWINIRIESRDQRRAIASALAAYDARNDVLNQQIKDWQGGRAYALVGRMVTSSVYTGERLALLYRIQAIDPMSGRERTIGYVAPKAGQDFRHMLGRIVGVIGSKNHDESLNLTVVDPDRIELMPE